MQRDVSFESVVAALPPQRQDIQPIESIILLVIVSANRLQPTSRAPWERLVVSESYLLKLLTPLVAANRACKRRAFLGLDFQGSLHIGILAGPELVQS